MCLATIKKHLTFHSHHVSIRGMTWSSIQGRLPCPFILWLDNNGTLYINQKAWPLPFHQYTLLNLTIPQEPLFGANSSVNHDRTWYSCNTLLLRNAHFTCVYLLNLWSLSMQPVGSQSPSHVGKLSLQKGEKDLPRAVMSFIRNNEIWI